LLASWWQGINLLGRCMETSQVGTLTVLITKRWCQGKDDMRILGRSDFCIRSCNGFHRSQLRFFYLLSVWCLSFFFRLLFSFQFFNGSFFMTLHILFLQACSYGHVLWTPEGSVTFDIYIYIYIYRERERESQLSMAMAVFIVVMFTSHVLKNKVQKNFNNMLEISESFQKWVLTLN